jgi:hypothetical protein
LKGAAFNWISLFLIDFIANKVLNNTYINNIKKEIIAYFYIIAGFKKGIQRVFRDIKEVRTAKIKLKKI